MEYTSKYLIFYLFFQPHLLFHVYNASLLQPLHQTQQSTPKMTTGMSSGPVRRSQAFGLQTQTFPEPHPIPVHTLTRTNTDWGTRPMKLGSWTRILLGQLGLNCTQTTCLLVKIVSHGPCYPQGYIPSDSKCWPNNLTTTTLQSWTLEQPEIQVGGKEIREGGFNLISLI